MKVSYTPEVLNIKEVLLPIASFSPEREYII